MRPVATQPDWESILASLEADGWRARSLPVERLADAHRRAVDALEHATFPPDTASHLRESVAIHLPERPQPARSVIVAATARPLTRAVLTWRGSRQEVHIPPHYAGYHTLPDDLAERVAAALRPLGYAAARFEPPLKTLAAGAGLLRYGRNNVGYVDDLGSYVFLAACVSDAPAPTEHEWAEAQRLDRCEHCRACLRACPTNAIGADRFILHTERCLTYHNESEDPLPDWIQPEWLHSAVGCLRCQQVCPENVSAGPHVAPAERFDEAETAALLAGDHTGLGPATRRKLERCGLDYSDTPIARNLRLLLKT